MREERMNRGVMPPARTVHAWYICPPLIEPLLDRASERRKLPHYPVSARGSPALRARPSSHVKMAPACAACVRDKKTHVFEVAMVRPSVGGSRNTQAGCEARNRRHCSRLPCIDEVSGQEASARVDQRKDGQTHPYDPASVWGANQLPESPAGSARYL